MITLGQLFNDIQADYIPGLSEMKPLRRAVARKVGDLNSKFAGVTRFDVGLKLIVAETTESVIFTSGTQVVTLTTTPTGVEAGDVLVVYDSDYNNKAYTISYVSTKYMYIMADEPIFTETVECSYAIYRPWRQPIFTDTVHLQVSYNNTIHTITSASQEVDFLEAGLEAGDYIRIEGATEVVNNSMFVIDTVNQYILVVKTLASSGTVTNDTNDPCVISTYKRDAYSYDLENHRFSLPKAAKKVKHVYSGNITEKLDQKSNIFLYKEENDEDSIYSVIARNVYAISPAYFTSADDILTFETRRDMQAPATPYRGAVIDIPEAYEDALFYGVVSYLFSLPQYFNKDLRDEVKGEYVNALIELTGNEEGRDRDVIYDRDYNW